MSRSQLSAEDRPIGAYVVDFRLRLDPISTDPNAVIAFELPLVAIASLRTHLDNAERALRERQRDDAVCGHCELCQNTRMVDLVDAGGRVSRGGEHCPVCRPKLVAAAEARAEGRPS